MIGEVIERYNRESLLERHGYRAPPGSAADSLVRRRNQATHLSRRPGALHDQHDRQGSKWKKVAQHWESSARRNDLALSCGVVSADAPGAAGEQTQPFLTWRGPAASAPG